MARDGIGLGSDRGPVLLAMLVAQALVAVEASILSAAVPTIIRDLGDFSAFPWLFSIYLLTFAVSIPLYSKLADLFGRKPVLLVGIGLFLLGSILCGLAWDMLSLIVFRAVQGLGAGAVQPVSVTIIGDIYTVAERAKVQGYIATVWATASVLGPTIGGVFALVGAWRGIFWVTVPLCVLAAWILWRNYHERVVHVRHRIDFAGAVLFAGSMTVLIYGVLQGGTKWAWDSPASFGVFALAAVLFSGFLLVERRAAEPVLPLRLARSRLVSSTGCLNLVFGAGVIGLTSFIPPYLEVGAGATPLVAGLALAAFMVGRPIAGSLSGYLFLRYGFRFATIVGGAVAVIGSILLLLAASWPSPLFVATICLVIGLGYGMTAVPSLIAAQSSVGWEERGVISGIVYFTRSLGQCVGAAVLGAVGNAVIAARGGDETDPSTIVAASGAVFAGVAVLSLAILAAALAMPRDAAPRAV